VVFGPGTPAYDNEIFGPVAPFISFATPGEAIDLASDSEYGLDLSIMTADIGAGLQMALRIPTGTAHINDQTVEDDANAPCGGMRHSGNSARFGGASPSAAQLAVAKHSAELVYRASCRRRHWSGLVSPLLVRTTRRGARRTRRSRSPEALGARTGGRQAAPWRGQRSLGWPLCDQRRAR